MLEGFLESPPKVNSQRGFGQNREPQTIQLRFRVHRLLPLLQLWTMVE